jgi:3-oxoacyl-[acyl-carrier protein] reductase
MKKILITGCSSGFGEAILKQLYNKYQIITLSRRMPNSVDKKYFDFYKTDLSNSNSLERNLKKIKKKYGYVENIINNSGVFELSKFKNIDKKKIDEFFNINAFSPVLIMNFFLPLMKKNNYGRIINITSGAPLNCFENASIYSASKSALNAFSLTASKEYSKYNIKINLFSPGYVKTEMQPNAKTNPKHSVKYLTKLLDPKKNLYTGKFLWTKYMIPLTADLKKINWSKGTAPKKFLSKK